MADDITLSPIAGSPVAATDEIGGRHFQRVKLIHGADGTNAGDISTTNGLPVAQSATNFVFSTVNSTTANLAASATFTGTVENVINQQVISLIARASQSLSITVNQYQDSGGTIRVATNAFTVAANTEFARSLALNGNYINVVVQNTGGSTTTSLTVDAAYGTLPLVTQLGNAPMSINEIGGTAFAPSTAFGDGESNSQVALPAEAYEMIFNGTTWDRMRGQSGSQNTRTVDTGRTYITLWANGAAAGTTGTETAITLTRSGSPGGSTTTGTSFTPTSGKRFRITSITFGSRGNATATAQVTAFALRVNTAGAVTTSSNIALSARTATPATALAWDRFSVSLPSDGIELVGDGTLQFGLTANAVFTTNAPTWDATITGYEYTP